MPSLNEKTLLVLSPERLLHSLFATAYEVVCFRLVQMLNAVLDNSDFDMILRLSVVLALRRLEYFLLLLFMLCVDIIYLFYHICSIIDN